MNKFFLRILVLLLVLSALFSARAMTKEEIRTAYEIITERPTAALPYAEMPDTHAYSAGALTDEAVQSALALTNLMRSVAGLNEVSIDPLYTLRAQNAALVLAANDVLSHTPDQPKGMGDDLYRSGYIGASSGNIAKLNWMHSDILLDGVRYFVRDDGDLNLTALSHRRWLLNPAMKSTGFGLANAESGNSFIVMYAIDDQNTDAAWDYVAWPSGGAFPVEWMQTDLAWSVSLNDALYDLSASDPIITLTEETTGLSYHFEPKSESGDGYCCISYDAYGSGSCLIFRPNFPDDFSAYEQNRIWNVSIANLFGTDGQMIEIQYRCEMVSLYPQDVANIEISLLSADLTVGETLSLSASVIPAYADDLSVLWSSSDPDIAAVDENGVVRAVSAGKCSITAASANGKCDSCEIAVSQ